MVSTTPRPVVRREAPVLGRFLVVSAEMLALPPFPVVLRDYTLVTLDP
jgi:hypothetical protein